MLRCARTRPTRYRHALTSALEMPTRASAMELNIPGIHGVGDSLIYFVGPLPGFLDLRRRFRAAGGVDPAPRSPACTTSAWCRPSRRPHRRLAWTLPKPVWLLGAAGGKIFRILPKGSLLESSLPQVLSAADRAATRVGGDPWDEALVRLGLGARDVPAGHARPAGTRHRVSSTRRRATQPAKAPADAGLSRRVNFELVVSHLETMNLTDFRHGTRLPSPGRWRRSCARFRAAGFTQVMLSAPDLVRASRRRGRRGSRRVRAAASLRVTGFQVHADFRGPVGHLHAYKVDMAKAMLRMMPRARRSEVLLACSSTSAHAAGDAETLIKDLQKARQLAVP